MDKVEVARMLAMTPIMQAWVDGKVIQVRRHNKEAWKDFAHNSADFSNGMWEWRIKPAAQVLYAVQYKNENGQLVTYSYSHVLAEVEARQAHLKSLSNVDSNSVTITKYVQEI